MGPGPGMLFDRSRDCLNRIESEGQKITYPS
jgi:hypothetical protein